jgi:hypothetical protein
MTQAIFELLEQAADNAVSATELLHELLLEFPDGRDRAAEDIFERLEDAIDSTERAAYVLEGVVIKNTASRRWLRGRSASERWRTA